MTGDRRIETGASTRWGLIRGGAFSKADWSDGLGRLEGDMMGKLVMLLAAKVAVAADRLEEEQTGPRLEEQGDMMTCLSAAD